ncbi:TolC family protein [Dyadobacter sp. NIV53]|uniref:TolC family protein n=1 Tax=Dyadobacter sp. NIV53 TaxID=2861765 RepID=UPI001C868445|nr:TolC family protein [Dyadobacter sp. NIV53]
MFFVPRISVQAQRIVTLDQAVEEAAKQNLLIRAGQQQVSQQEALISASFDPPKTTLDVQYGQTQARQNDYTATAIQSFSPLSVYKTQKQLAEGNVKTSEYQLNSNRLRLSNEVKRAYYQLIYDQKLLTILDQQSVLFAESARSADIRFKTGETNRLESVSAQSKYQQMLQRIRYARREQLIHYASLRLLLQTNDSIRIDTGTVFKRISAANAIATLNTDDNPIVGLLRQHITNSQIQTKLQQKSGLPDWRIGYVNQSIAKSSNYNVVHAGISVNIFTKAQKAKIQALKIQEHIQQTTLEYTSQQITTELNTLAERQRNLSANLDYYQSYALPQAELIRETALSSYRNGEAGYLEFFAAIQQAYQVQEEYLLNVLDYDFNLIRIEEVSGQY